MRSGKFHLFRRDARIARLYNIAMKLYRLSGRKVCERVKTKGLLWKGKHLFARYLLGLPRAYPESSPSGIYVGTLTSTKLDKSAVKRNRMRRRCREALRIHVRDLMAFPAIQLLILPRSSSLECNFEDLQRDIDSLLSHLNPRAGRP